MKCATCGTELTTADAPGSWQCFGCREAAYSPPPCSVPSISLLAASVALKEYLESPACTVPGFDIPDEIWMPFADAVEAEDEKANNGMGGGTSAPCRVGEEVSDE